MRVATAQLWVGGCALVLAMAALASGPLPAFVAAPIAVFLTAQAVGLRDGAVLDAPRRLIGGGVIAGVLALALLFAAPPLLAFATFAAALGVVVCGSRLALDRDPPPDSLAQPAADPLRLGVGVALDETVRFGWELARLVGPKPDYERVAADLRSAADRNQEMGWLDHPALAHLPPPPLEKSHLVTRHLRGAGVCEHLTFPSEFEPQDPEIRAAYLEGRRNRTAHAALWRHRGEPRPTLICLHPYRMGRFALDARAWNVGWLHGELGFDVVQAVMPLHGPRALGRRSGAGFLDGHPLWTNAALGQSVWDLRRLVGWLRSQGAPSIGVVGLSLGGYVAALFASVDDRLACAVPMIPIVSLEDFAWRQLPPRRRAEARAAGQTPQLLARAWARHAPLRMRPHVSHEARLVVGGVADRIVPPGEVLSLWEHWGRPAVHWFPGSHTAWFGRAAVRERVAAHLRRHLQSETVWTG